MKEYEDMLQLPHPLLKGMHHMTRQMRAAQFAPFAALSGYEDRIREEEEKHLRQQRI